MADSAAAPLFKKKAARSRDVRQRPGTIDDADASTGDSAPSHEDGAGPSRSLAAEDGGEPARSEVVLKRKAPALANALVQRTAGAVALANKRQRLHEGDDDGDVDVDEYARMGAVDRFGERTVHSSAGPRPGAGAGAVTGSSRDKAREDATRDRNWNGADDGGGGGGAVSKVSRDDPEAGAGDDGLYRGLSAYKSHAPEQRDDGSSSKFRAKGPIKPTANIRTISVVDYQPDVCKDYKETGYCGFGDTCKFLHDRSDYLAGWQLALVPEAYSGGKRRDDVSLGVLDAAGAEVEDEEEEIPFACLICRQAFTEPVVTRCGHYFCQACAVKRYTKNPKCFACGKPTHGLFNAATKILARMEKKRALRAAALRERRAAWGQGEDGAEAASGEILAGVEIG